VKFIHRIIALR